MLPAVARKLNGKFASAPHTPDTPNTPTETEQSKDKDKDKDKDSSVQACFHCKTTQTPLWRVSKLPSHFGEKLCNRCGLYEKVHKQLPSLTPKPPKVPFKDEDQPDQCCFHCKTSTTPMWRASKLHPGERVCNRCGLQESSHGRLPQDQSPSVPRLRNRKPSSQSTTPTARQILTRKTEPLSKPISQSIAPTARQLLSRKYEGHRVDPPILIIHKTSSIRSSLQKDDICDSDDTEHELQMYGGAPGTIGHVSRIEALWGRPNLPPRRMSIRGPLARHGSESSTSSDSDSSSTSRRHHLALLELMTNAKLALGSGNSDGAVTCIDAAMDEIRQELSTDQ
ncbi:gata zinc finger domain-containing protein [Moniliophthora roreri]|nr:gata zinc finger domain-containing protein [Moniliophthora roreri]